MTTKETKLILITGPENSLLISEAQKLSDDPLDIFYWPEMIPAVRRKAEDTFRPAQSLPQKQQFQHGLELAERAAKAARGWVIIVTHSDHVFNGIRVAVKRGLIPPDCVELKLISPFGEDSSSEVMTIDADGRLDAWPAGFFDQTEMNLSELL